MTRKPARAVIATDEARMVERQRRFRVAADVVTAALARFAEVEAVALIGSVARPLRREVPRFAPYRRLGLPIAHECGDVDLAVWVSGVDGLGVLRKARVQALAALLAPQTSGIADHEVEVFLLEAGTGRYLGRLCLYRACPAGKRNCAAVGCGAAAFLQQHDGFSFWPDALAGAVRLFDRAAGGIVGRAVELPGVVLSDGGGWGGRA